MNANTSLMLRRAIFAASALIVAVDLDVVVQQIDEARSWWTVTFIGLLIMAVTLAVYEIVNELRARQKPAPPPGVLSDVILGVSALISVVALASVAFVHVDKPDVTLVMSTFGEPFPSDLKSRYEDSHPGIDLDIVSKPYVGYSKSIHDQLVELTPEYDLVVMEKNYFSLYGASANDFADLDDAAIAGRWGPLARTDMSSRDGTKLLGLPLDVGGMALCYRKDLFRQAGLSDDPDHVTRDFASWDSYLKLGARFHAANPEVAWVDSGAHLLNGILATSPQPVEMSNGRLTSASSASVGRAWVMASSAVRRLGSARANTEAALERTLRKAQFATMSCPSWAIGRVERLTADSGADWGIVAPPGGSGNWGGTFVAVPKSRHHIEQAAELARWLTEPAQQSATYNALRIYPALVHTPSDVLGYRSKLFVGADVAGIIRDSLQDLSRSQDQDLNSVIANACIGPMAAVERGASPHAQWPAAWRSIQSSLSV